VTNLDGESRGLYEWKSGQWLKIQPSLSTYRDLFRFAPGDVANFRQGSVTKSYKALSHVTPIFDPSVYIKAGIFEEEPSLTETVVKWVDPEYRLETIVYEKSKFGAFNFYRCIRSENPDTNVSNWNNQLTPATPRLSELRGKTLKIVKKVECGDEFLPRILDGASALKLGTASITLRSKDSLGKSQSFVLESADYRSEVPEFSTSPEVDWDYPAVDYGQGTLDL